MSTIIDLLSKHAPVLFTGLGVVGTGVTTYAMYEESPDIHKALEELDENAGILDKSLAVIKHGWKTILFGGATITCDILAHRSSAKLIAGLSGAVALAASQRDSLLEAIKEEVPEKETDILERAKEEFNSMESEQNERVRVYENLLHLNEGRWLTMSFPDIYSALIDANKDFQLNGEISVNRLYSFLCIPKYRGKELKARGDVYGFTLNEDFMKANKGLCLGLSLKRCKDEEGIFYILDDSWWPAKPIDHYGNRESTRYFSF